MRRKRRGRVKGGPLPMGNLPVLGLPLQSPTLCKSLLHASLLMQGPGYPLFCQTPPAALSPSGAFHSPRGLVC
eukprot:775357-Pelagomonas_calceolata.AAC.2